MKHQLILTRTDFELNKYREYHVLCKIGHWEQEVLGGKEPKIVGKIKFVVESLGNFTSPMTKGLSELFGKSGVLVNYEDGEVSLEMNPDATCGYEWRNK